MIVAFSDLAAGGPVDARPVVALRGTHATRIAATDNHLPTQKAH
ncbi:hypothetical protein Pd630_LPD00295 [Rhodococcus opacus PD630]|nr:hypothetical protein Pd630_LPD00295 [Rhodococcus opacus PD630]